MPPIRPRTSNWISTLALALAVMAGGCAGSRTEVHPPDMLDEPYEQAWLEVDSLENQGLPRSASAVVETIYAKAASEGDEPQLIKSLIYRAKYRQTLEDDSINELVAELEEHAGSASPAASAILHSVLGDVLWSHLQANRYLYYGRTALASAAQRDDDILTWDLSRLVGAALSHYRASLRDADVLLATPVETYDLLLIEQPDGRRFRPTLFDLLAHRALDVFENTESGLTQPEQPFVVDAEALLVPAADFVAIDFSTADSLSLDAEALRIHQDLLRAHMHDAEDDADDAPLVHSNLRRLGFVRDRGLGVDGTAYLGALTAFADRLGDDPLVAYVDLARAHELHREGQSYDPMQSDDYKWKLRDAVEVCRAIQAAYSGSEPAVTCAGLVESVSQEVVGIDSDGVVVPGQPSVIRVEFKNARTLYLRVYQIDVSDALSWFTNRRPSNEAFDTLIQNGTPVLSTEYALPVDGDHQTHSTEVILPALDMGAYVIVAGNAADLNRVTATRIVGRTIASRLSFFNRTTAEGAIALYVVDRETGHPIADADVTPFRITGANRTPTRLAPLSTDVHGRVTIPSLDRESVMVEIRHEQDWVFSESQLYPWNYYRPDDTPRFETKFFTDRSIYRPGQQIYFKGILLRREGDRYTIRTNATTDVRLADVNGREVAKATLRSNEFGTVSGQFTAPTGGLTGVMSIQDEHGSAFVSVEEYKRPRFEAKLEPPDGSVALGDSLTLHGTATTFAGAPVGGAQVSYRVQRTASFPWFRGGWRMSYLPVSNPAEIAHGVVETNPDGSFDVTFVPRADPDVRTGSLPVYRFNVTADVTDLAGETQSANATVRIGERSLVLALALESGQVIDRSSVDSLRVSTSTLAGNPVAARGRIRLSKLVEPDAVLRPHLSNVDTVSVSEAEWRRAFPHLAYPGKENPEGWSVEDEVLDTSFSSTGGRPAAVAIDGAESWPIGMYRVELTADDDQGREVRVVSHFRLIDSSGSQIPGTVPSWFHLATGTVEPGDEAVVLYGSSDDDVRILLETEIRGEIVDSRWETVSSEQKSAVIPIVEDHRGNIAVHATVVRHGHFLGHSAVIRVPWTNKDLDLRWETFRDKLEPGQDEVWRLRIRGPKGEAVAAELVATLYDASLDEFKPHGWAISVWPTYGSRLGFNGGDLNRSVRYRQFNDRPRVVYSEHQWAFDALNLFGLTARFGRQFLLRAGRADEVFFAQDVVAEVSAEVSTDKAAAPAPAANEAADADGPGIPPAQPPAPPSLRSNFDETAFFLPVLRTNAEGEIVLEFTMPESLTRWRFLGLAHTQALEIGQIEAEAVTQRELMITTNAPRFLRHGDQITITATVDNLSDGAIDGTAGIRLTNALTAEPLGVEIRPADRSAFSVSSESSERVAWTFDVPDGVDAIGYQVDATSSEFADGEESVLPVLTNRMLVTESLPLPMRGPGVKEFTFERLLNVESPTLRHERVTVEYTANPVWYAVQALPYMMEYPHECAEQIFARVYANGIATYLVDANPRIEEIFDAWIRDSAPSLVSNLERNQDLKALLIEETPWVRQAADESARKRRIATLFDLARMRGEVAASIGKLAELQLPDGSWPWFAGMRSDRFTTQHIVKGIGMMRRMGVLELLDDARPVQMAQAGVAYIDAQLAKDYENLVERKVNLDEQNITQLQIHALYARSFFHETGIVQVHQQAHDYYMGQLAKYGLEFSVYGQGMAAITLHRSGNTARATQIIASLRENARQSDELGMYWPIERGWWWYQAPIETQALLIEAFHEVADDQASVETMQLWLLKQKQTQDWKTTRATTDAVYALLQRGPRLLDEPGSVTVTLGDEVVSTDAPGAEAGTGYVKASWSGQAVDTEMGNVTVEKVGPGPAWGAVYWQYFEDLDRITPAETPLSIEKELYVQRNTSAGPKLELLSETDVLEPGDLVHVRVVIRTDRDMEYIHLKDMRASGFEPVNVLSGFRWKDGLGYYESTRDASTNFFISYLARGTYVFEYPLRVRHAGDFSNGITTIQSMYAPEFGAHSAGVRVRVRE